MQDKTKTIFVTVSSRISPGTINGIYTLLGEGISRVLIVLGTLYAARQMGITHYGEYGILWAQLLIAWSIIEFGTTLTGTRDFARAMQEGTTAEVFSGILYLRLALWGLVVGLWSLWKIVVGLAADHSDWANLAMAFLCLLAMLLTPDWVLRARERFALMGKAQFGSALIYLAAVVSLTSHFRSVASLLLAHVIQAAALCLLQWWALRHCEAPSLVAPSSRLLLQYGRRGALFALTGALLQGAIAGFIWGVGPHFGSAAMGLATALMRIYQLVNAASFMLAVGYFPRLAKRQERAGDEVASLRRLMFLSGAVFALAFPLVAVPLAERLLGSEFSGLVPLAWGAALGLFLGAARYVHSIPLTARVRHRETIYANSAYCVAALGLTILLGEWCSMDWISWAITGAEGAALVVISLAVKRGWGRGDA